MRNAEKDWVSVRLREAAHIVAEKSDYRQLDRLLFELADRAQFMERNDIDPLRESNWGMVFANAVIFAAWVLEEFNGAS